ncbi:MAG: ankyrin repeat domain-containing protein [Pseudomonadota bacterium]
MHLNIEKLRTAAKRLKKAFHADDAQAVERLRAVVAEPKAPRHADFLHVVAREHGFESWPKLKFAVEAAQMTREQRIDRLVRAVYFGQNWVVANLLNEDPTLPNDDLRLQIALYDHRAVAQAVSASPAVATTAIGPRTPILHLAYSQHIHMAPEKRQAMLEIADLLVQHGADVNDGFAPDPEADHRLSALYGALGHANNLALAEWLLDHGATPDDHESLYHATELGHHDGLKLLMKHSVNTRGTNALLRAMDFDDAEAVRLLLAYGADPNETVTGHPSEQPVDRIPALHQAARRWCSAEIADLLLDHNAEPLATWQGHTPFAMATIYGNFEVAQRLSARGYATPLSRTEQTLAQCAQGVAPTTPLNLDSLHEEDRRLLTRLAATPSALAHIKALIAAGLDPDEPDEMAVTPLHAAGWQGFPDYVTYFLSLDPDLTYENAYGGDALGTAIHGSEFCPDAKKRDHISCVRLLLEAGARLNRNDVEGCGNEDMVLFLEDWAISDG